MRKGLTIGAATGLVLAAGGIAVGATSASSDPSRSRESGDVLRLVGKEVSSRFLDLADADFSEGDQFVFTNDLLRGDKKVGEDGGWCTVTRLTQEGANTWECHGVNSLPGGQITVQGIVTYAPNEEIKAEPYQFAITGGTGRYRDVGGTVRIQEVSGEKVRLTFRLSD
jgi:allene oxide cyclase-like protein